MEPITSQQLLDQLRVETRRILLSTTQLLQEDPEILLLQPAPGKWSATQVVEHLNTYGRYYLPLMQKFIGESKEARAEFFKSGWLGGFATRSMLPKENGKIKYKMKATADHSPENNFDSKQVLEEFIAQEQLLLQILESAANANLNTIKIPISISKWIRLNLGDTLSFLVAHHQRHFLQIENTLMAVKAHRQLSFG